MKDNFDMAMEIKKSTREARPGDVVIAKGIRCTIAKIYYQDFGPSDRCDGTCDWDIEFVDTNGNYRSWKQYYDGGKIEFANP